MQTFVKRELGEITTVSYQIKDKQSFNILLVKKFFVAWNELAYRMTQQKSDSSRNGDEHLEKRFTHEIVWVIF